MNRTSPLRRLAFSRSLVAAALGLLAIIPAVAAPGAAPKYDHIVLVIMENHSFNQIFATGGATFLRKLAKGGAVFTRSFAVAHPSQPNYFALFTGSTHGVRDDGDHDLSAPNLATALRAANKSFAGYAESDSPRKHNPWESFAGAQSYGKPLSDFPTDYGRLPSVSFVIPNLGHDMHDGTIEAADGWLKDHLGDYAEWATRHNSLLIVTFDEDDYHSSNRILTILYGDKVRAGQYSVRIDHQSVLRTLTTIEGIPPLGESRSRTAIRGIWTTP